MPRLTDASVTVGATTVVLTYDTDTPSPPGAGVLTFSTFVEGDGRIRQLGFKLIDGDLAGVFTFDHNQTRNVYNGVEPRRVGGRWSVVFPVDALGGITSGTWRATIDADGTESGTVSGTLAEG